jgi:Fe-S cluster assembly protein SufD
MFPKTMKRACHCICSEGFGTGNTLVARNLVVLERGAQLSLIEQYVGDAVSRSAVVASELILGDGATLQYTSMQTWGANVRHMGHQVAKVGNDATIIWTAVNIGAAHQHIDAETYLGGNGARVDLDGSAPWPVKVNAC